MISIRSCTMIKLSGELADQYHLLIFHLVSSTFKSDSNLLTHYFGYIILKVDAKVSLVLIYSKLCVVIS